MSYGDPFRVKPGSAPKLSEIDPNFKDKHVDKEAAGDEIAKHVEKMRDLQHLLHAEGRHSLLICLQGMDAGGKDGTIKHVLGAMDPMGTRVHSFKIPTPEEAAHDFLWRYHAQAPRQGEIVIFNRTHYESVLVERVHNLVPKEVWSKRYNFLNDFEQSLVENGTRVLKFYLHISPDEQLERFRGRLDDPEHRWKISEGDYKERKFWPEYVAAYEEAFAKTSTKEAPWFLIPANHKWFRNLAISKIVVETLMSFDMKFPKPTVDLDEIRRKYHAAEKDEKKIEKKFEKRSG